MMTAEAYNHIIEGFCCLEFARVLSSDILSGGALVRLL